MRQPPLRDVSRTSPESPATLTVSVRARRASRPPRRARPGERPTSGAALLISERRVLQRRRIPTDDASSDHVADPPQVALRRGTRTVTSAPSRPATPGQVRAEVARGAGHQTSHRYMPDHPVQRLDHVLESISRVRPGLHADPEDVVHDEVGIARGRRPGGARRPGRPAGGARLPPNSSRVADLVLLQVADRRRSRVNGASGAHGQREPEPARLATPASPRAG